MNTSRLSLESLSVESFVTGAGTESTPAFGGAPTNNCNTRLTICTVPPVE